MYAQNTSVRKDFSRYSISTDLAEAFCIQKHLHTKHIVNSAASCSTICLQSSSLVSWFTKENLWTWMAL